MRGVLKAPVDSFWRRSNISCSSLGRRGGAGPLPKGLLLSLSATRRLYEDVKERRGEQRRVRLLMRATARGSISNGEGFIVAVFQGNVCESGEIVMLLGRAFYKRMSLLSSLCSGGGWILII